MIYTENNADAKRAEVGSDAGFGWADKMLAMDLAEDEIRQIVALLEEPSSWWIRYDPVPDGQLAKELNRWGLDRLDAGDPFCDGFVEGVIGAWYLNV